jgi:ribosome recycling factor
MPKEEKDAIEHAEEIFGYLKQSRISEKNIDRLKTLSASSNPRIAELATIAVEVATVKPFKKGRLKALARERSDLFDALERTGLIAAHHW